jgi:hypothetical protein
MKNYTLNFVKVSIFSIMFFLASSSITRAQKIYGKDFWFVFNNNDDAVMSSAANPYKLIIISVNNVNGVVSMPAIGWSTTFTVAANSQTVVQLPYNPSGQTIYPSAFLTTQGKGIHITTDNDATVYAVSGIADGTSSDGEVVLPSTFLGTNYAVASRSSAQSDLINDAAFTVCATQNATNVVIKTWYMKKPTSATSVQRDTTYNVTLDAGQTYSVGYVCLTVGTRTNQNNQMNFTTGSNVSANKNITVVGSSKCSRLIDCGACDVMLVQPLPTSQWGNRYIVVQPIKRTVSSCGTFSTTSGDYIEIIGTVGQQIQITNWNGTTTKTIPALPFTAGLAQTSGISPYSFLWYDNPVNPSITSPENYGEANLVLTSASPFGLVQYQKDGYTDNLLYTDPESTQCYPESMWTNNYLAGTATTGGGAPVQDIVIVVNNTGAPAPITTFAIDGTAVPSVTCAGNNPPPGENCWQSFKGPSAADKYMFIRVPATPGVAHVITNTLGVNFGFYYATRSNAGSYIVQGGGGAAPLLVVPVKLLSFKVKELVDRVAIDWVTATEINSSSFVIERSADGINFEDKSGRILAAGNSTATLAYHYDDKEPNIGPNYYRLKQIDNDGKFAYSSIQYLNYQKERLFAVSKINPNPSKDNFTISYTSGSENVVTINVMDISGRTIKSVQNATNIGENQYSLNMTEFENGIYFVKMQQNGAVNNIQTKIIKN